MPSAVIATLVGIVGTILATVLGARLTQRGEKSRADREEKQYWRGQRLGAYALLLGSMAEQVSSSHDYAFARLGAAHEGRMRSRPGEGLTRTLDSLKGTRRATRQALAHVELLSGQSVGEAARRLVEVTESHDEVCNGSALDLALLALNASVPSDEPENKEDIREFHGSVGDDPDERSAKTSKAIDGIGAVEASLQVVATARLEFCLEAQRELGVPGS